MRDLGQEMTLALRSLSKAPGFASAVVLTLALGLGATTAAFSVLNTVLLRPLPFPEPGRVVSLAWQGGGHLQSALSVAKFNYWREGARSLGAMATWRHAVLRDDQGTTGVLNVSPDFFDVVSLPPALGRTFLSGDHLDDRPGVALISHRLWRNRFGEAPDVVGQTLRMGDQTLVVVGVLTEAFAFPYESSPVDVIVPLRLPPVAPDDVAENWPAIARLADGHSLQEASEEVVSLNRRFGSAYPEQGLEHGGGMRVVGFSDLYVAEGTRRALYLLLGGVGLILIIACANAANLFLVRASRRQREIAVRAALGATRAQITRLVLTESLLVAVLAAGAGLVLASWFVDVLVGMSPVEIPEVSRVYLDWRVLAFSFVTALATGLAFGSPAAFPVGRLALSEVLKERGRSSASGRRGTGLLVAQGALSTLLLAAAGLLMQTLLSLNATDPGWDPRATFAVRLDGDVAASTSSQALWDFQERVLQGVSGSPHIVSIAGASSLPLDRGVNVPITVTGQPEHSGSVEWRAITPGYFHTLRIPSVAGRTFQSTDAEGDLAVAIVNESFARAFFPDGSPLGQRLDLGSFRGEFIDPAFVDSTVEVVGVVADVRDTSLRVEPRRILYVPQAQATARLTGLLGQPPFFVVRSHSGLRAVEEVLTEAIAVARPGAPGPQVTAFEDIVAASLTRERFAAALVLVLAGLALTLTAFGIYGILAQIVRERRREIGIRMALGARTSDVTRMVIAQGTGPVLVGLVGGLGASVALSGLIRPFLWGVTPANPGILVAVSSVLLGVALTASWIPARTAAGIEPATTLGSE